MEKFQLAAHRPIALTLHQPGALRVQEMEGKSNEILIRNGEGVLVKSIKEGKNQWNAAPRHMSREPDLDRQAGAYLLLLLCRL